MKLGLIFTLWLISIEDLAFGIAVRLVGGISKYEGRVEVYHNQTWGTVCDDLFDNLDAQVFCSMLGFERNGARAVLRAFYGEGTGTIWLDDLGCDGTENSFVECKGQTWGAHNCRHIEDAGIVCKPLDIRLIGGQTPYEGRVEVFHSRNWGTVCDSNFGTFQAQVLCQVLGYPREGAVAYDNAYFGQGNGTVWLSNIDCDVQDSNFLNCRNISLLPSNCDHTQDAGVRCKPRVRLIGGPSVYEGRVEVLYSNRWGTVCNTAFDVSDAQVFCHMLGYKRNGTIAKYGPGNGTVLFNGLRCSGAENSVDDCSIQEDTVSNPPCPHTSDVGIKCQPKTGCSSLSLVTNGEYSESNCTISMSHVGLNCVLICSAGFKPTSHKNTTCLGTGIWDVSDVFLTCEDINECEDNPCNKSQTCENKAGTFDCRCNEGYTLSKDNKTCIGLTVLPKRLVTNITEDAPKGTVVGEFAVHDPDTDMKAEISVYSDDKPVEIKINSILNDTVQLVVEGKLDADKYRNDVEEDRVGPVFNFTIMVEDNRGLVVSAYVSLTIIDVNDNSPICNPSGVTVKIPRDSQIGTNMFSVNDVCRDEDYFYKDAVYAIEDDTCSAFGVHTSGELYVKRELLSALSSCLVTVNVTDRDNVLYSTTLDVTIEFLECPPDMDYLNILWKRGIPGKFMQGQCPEGYTGKVTRFCAENGVYYDPVYNCTKREIAEIFEKVLNENTSASDVLDELANVTTTAHVNKSLLVGDLEAVNKVMSKLTEIIEVKPENVEKIANSFIETANNILDEKTTTSWTSKMNQTGSGADTVLENLDNFVEKIANVSTTTGKLKVKKSNLYLAVGPTSDCKENTIQFPNRANGDVPEWAEKTLDTVQMPCDGNRSFKSYSSVLYRNLSKILPSTSVNRSIAERKLNAPVMSFTFFPKPEQDLDSPIELTFQLYNSSFKSPACSFWSKNDSAWSSDGCWLDQFIMDKKTVVCKCNHLTNFAVLMSPSPRVSSDHHVALSTISMVGCILSMICLASTVGIYGFFWRTVKSEKSIMNMNLCCVLFVAYLVFLAGVNNTENKSACTAVAVLLHLVYLIAFFVMLSEGLILANTVLYPFSTRKPGVPLLIASYAIAVLIVAISMGAVKLQGYGGENSCWLSSSSGLVWAFLVPVLLVLVINIVIVTLVIRKLFTTAVMSKKTDKEKARAGVRSIIVLMPIMGITWILGVFSVSEDTVVFQYLFALFNSVQGVLIFVFHCVMNKKIQTAFKKKVSRWQSVRSYDVHKSVTHSTKSSRFTDESTSAM